MNAPQNCEHCGMEIDGARHTIGARYLCGSLYFAGYQSPACREICRLKKELAKKSKE